MYKTIVIPVDGSELAARAVLPASWLAARFGAEIHLVTTTFADDIGEAEDTLRRAATHAGSVPVRTDVIRRTFPARAVLDVAQSDDEALLCLSTRGTSGLAGLLLGSVSDEIVRGTSDPLLLIGPACEPIAPDEPRLLVCVDGSDESAQVLPVAADWATDLGMTTEVILVADAHRFASFRTTTEEQVGRAAGTLSDAGLESTARLEVASKPAEAIVDVADATRASIIAMATPTTGPFYSQALGHVVTDVVRHAHVPVLVVPVRGGA